MKVGGPELPLVGRQTALLLSEHVGANVCEALRYRTPRYLPTFHLTPVARRGSCQAGVRMVGGASSSQTDVRLRASNSTAEPFEQVLYP